MCQRQTWKTLTPKEPQRSWNPTGKWPNLTYRRGKKAWRDYWCKTWLKDIPESRPSARHPTKRLFTAQLRVGHECHRVLMLQRFEWIFWFRLFWRRISISFCGWPWQTRCDVKASCPPYKGWSCLPSLRWKKTGWRMTPGLLKQHWMCPCQFQWGGNGSLPPTWTTYIRM